MLRVVALLVVAALTAGQSHDSGIHDAEPQHEALQAKTAQLMDQVLTAVSSKEDSSLLNLLCSLVHQIEASLTQLQADEAEEADFALAHLRSELSLTRVNISLTRQALNASTQAETNRRKEFDPVDAALREAKAKEEPLVAQKEKLVKECEEDIQGQHFRVGAVNTDLSILEEVFVHMGKLKDLSSEEGGEGGEEGEQHPASFLQIGEGEEGEEGKPKTAGPISQHPAQNVRELDFDSLDSLLGKLKVDLFRSLAYEHDTTNATKRHCSESVRQQDKDLRVLDDEVSALSARHEELWTALENATRVKVQTQGTLQALQDNAIELVERIEARERLAGTREEVVQGELKTLKEMKVLITEKGGFPCLDDAVLTPAFKKADLSQCSGEVMDLSLVTSDPEECKPLCVGECVAFNFEATLGCRFLASVQQKWSGCAGGTKACACYEKTSAISH